MTELREKVVAAIRNEISVTIHPEEDGAYDYEVDVYDAADSVLNIPEIREALGESTDPGVTWVNEDGSGGGGIWPTPSGSFQPPEGCTLTRPSGK